MVKGLRNNAIVPKRGTSEAVGYDLSLAKDTMIPRKGEGLVQTRLAIAIPVGTYAKITPRYGLVVK